MNLAACFGLSASLAAAATLAGCVDEQEEPAPYYVPPSARAPRRSPAPPPLPVTHLPYYEYESAGDYGTPRPRSPHTIDLGYIGDWQFGYDGAPSGESPQWARPFPCNWTRSCGMTSAASPNLGSTRYGYAYAR